MWSIYIVGLIEDNSNATILVRSRRETRCKSSDFILGSHSSKEIENKYWTISLIMLECKVFELIWTDLLIRCKNKKESVDAYHWQKFHIKIQNIQQSGFRWFVSKNWMNKSWQK